MLERKDPEELTLLSSHLVLRLDPERLTNPDLDLRYLVPQAIELYCQGEVRDDAYDYGEKTSHLFLYLLCDDPLGQAPRVIRFLQEEAVLGNCLAQAATLAIAHHLHEESLEVLFPTPGTRMQVI